MDQQEDYGRYVVVVPEHSDKDGGSRVEGAGRESFGWKAALSAAGLAGASSAAPVVTSASALALGIGASTFFLPLTLGVAGVGAAVTAKSWFDGRGKDGVLIRRLTASDAKMLRFGQGGVQLNHVYVQHPAIKHQYYSLASFHRLVFDHKLSEAVRLLMFLGAKRIRAEHVSGWSKDFAADLSCSAGVKLASEAKGGTNSAQSSSILFEADYPNNDSFCLPEGMVWFPDEPTWGAIADSRLVAKATKVKLTVRYEEDFGVNGTFKAAAEKAGFGVGGNFVAHKNTIWNLDADF